jgi:hypothetical protein
MLRHIEPKVLLGSAKGLHNFETIKKATKDHMYEGVWEGVNSVAFCPSSSDSEG